MMIKKRWIWLLVILTLSCLSLRVDADVVSVEEELDILLKGKALRPDIRSYYALLDRYEKMGILSMVEKKFIFLYSATGVNPLPLSGYETNFTQVFSRSFPYLGASVARVYRTYKVLPVPGMCHWNIGHFETLSAFFDEFNLGREALTLVYALPNKGITSMPPGIYNVRPSDWVKRLPPDDLVPLTAAEQVQRILSYGGRWISHLTWGLPNTVIGGIFALGYVIGGIFMEGDLNFKFINGAFVVNSGLHEKLLFFGYEKKDSHFTIGPFYFGGESYNSHEAGHTYQAALLGPLYLPSALISAVFFRDVGGKPEPDQLLNWFSGNVKWWGKFDEKFLQLPPPKTQSELIGLMLAAGADVELLDFLNLLSADQRTKIKSVLERGVGEVKNKKRQASLKRTIALRFSHLKLFQSVLNPHEVPSEIFDMYVAFLAKIIARDVLRESFWVDLSLARLETRQRKAIFKMLKAILLDGGIRYSDREQLRRLMLAWKDSVFPSTYFSDKDLYVLYSLLPR